MTLESLTRGKAFAIHLAISALIAAVVLTLIVLVWYPPPYFDAMGGAVLLRLLIGVDVVLGPLITLIIFNPKKPRLRADLATIAALQIAALAYGGYVMFEARPVFNVFVKDRFETVPANRIDDASLGRAAAQFRDLSLTGPRVVAATSPRSREESAKILWESLRGGPDVADLPHLYVPYADAAMQVANASQPLVRLAQRGSETAELVNAFLAANSAANRSLGYVPVVARNRDFAAVVDRKTGEIVGYLPVNPW
jgi:hypothetical protein